MMLVSHMDIHSLPNSKKIYAGYQRNIEKIYENLGSGSTEHKTVRRHMGERILLI
jgi:hypothetical protein